MQNPRFISDLGRALRLLAEMGLSLSVDVPANAEGKRTWLKPKADAAAQGPQAG